MEILLLLASVGFGKIPALKVIIADLVQKVSWASFVCIGVAIGTVIARGRSSIIGLAGFISAPLAFHIARVLHKSTVQALAITGPAASMPSPLILALIKAVEYACLGYFIGFIRRKSSAGIGAHTLVGALTGIIFGGTILFLAITQTAGSIPVFTLVARALNEIIFPVGCAWVLFAAEHFKARVETSQD